jgi:hypothetical protein
MDEGPDLAEILDAQQSYRVASLLSGSSPDSTDPTARDWLRRWGTSGLQPKPLKCACATGRCRICN